MKSVEEAIEILEQYTDIRSEKKIKEIKNFIDTTDGNKTGYICFAESILSLPTYKKIRDLTSLEREKTIIIDCGCGLGIQQILFKDYYKYIGIDVHKILKDSWQLLQSNTLFYNGTTETVLDQVIRDIKDEMRETNRKLDIVGVSVLCHAYFKGQGLEKFKEVFDYMICI